MSEIDGFERAEQVRRTKPSIRVLYVSGYSDASFDKVLPRGAAFLQKPVTPLTLVKKVRDLLDQGE